MTQCYTLNTIQYLLLVVVTDDVVDNVVDDVVDSVVDDVADGVIGDAADNVVDDVDRLDIVPLCIVAVSRDKQ